MTTTSLSADAALLAGREDWESLLVLSDAAEEVGDDWLADRMRRMAHLFRTLNQMRSQAIAGLQPVSRNGNDMDECAVVGDRFVLIAQRQYNGSDVHCHIEISLPGLDVEISSGWNSDQYDDCFPPVGGLLASYLQMPWRNVFSQGIWDDKQTSFRHHERWRTLAGGFDE